MAATNEYLVIFNQQPAGSATENYKFENTGGTATAANCTSAGSSMKQARTVVVKAETEQIAATGVKIAFGEGYVTGPMQVILTSNIKEKSA